MYAVTLHSFTCFTYCCGEELIEWLGIWIAMHPVVCYDTIVTSWLLAGAARLTTKRYKIFPV
jgi:hypothetical protein